jgi:hypothetical protein
MINEYTEYLHNLKIKIKIMTKYDSFFPTIVKNLASSFGDLKFAAEIYVL